jgi:hypothetical protein
LVGVYHVSLQLLANPNGNGKKDHTQRMLKMNERECDELIEGVIKQLNITPRQGLNEYKKGYAKAEEDLRGKTMSKEQALRILKLLSGLEVIVFQKSEGVPDHTIDELIKIVDELTDYVLEK